MLIKYQQHLNLPVPSEGAAQNINETGARGKGHPPSSATATAARSRRRAATAGWRRWVTASAEPRNCISAALAGVREARWCGLMASGFLVGFSGCCATAASSACGRGGAMGTAAAAARWISCGGEGGGGHVHVAHCRVHSHAR